MKSQNTHDPNSRFARAVKIETWLLKKASFVLILDLGIAPRITLYVFHIAQCVIILLLLPRFNDFI